MCYIHKCRSTEPNMQLDFTGPLRQGYLMRVIGVTPSPLPKISAIIVETFVYLLTLVVELHQVERVISREVDRVRGEPVSAAAIAYVGVPGVIRAIREFPLYFVEVAVILVVPEHEAFFKTYIGM